MIAAKSRERELDLSGFGRSGDGYLIAPGGAPEIPGSVGQQAMQSSLLPQIYERAWRPVLFAGFAGGRLGATAPDQIAAGLELDPDALALDVACGPGNTTRPLLAHIGEAGRVVGLDAAPAMLARAVRDTDDPRASYVLGDAGALPFASATFDAVTCLGGLYLMDEPHRVLAELVRVLAPGGRLAILTSAVRGPVPARPLLARMNLLTGVRLFDQDEVADRLRLLGMQRVRRHLQGFFQLVTATAPEAGRG